MKHSLFISLFSTKKLIFCFSSLFFLPSVFANDMAKLVSSSNVESKTETSVVPQLSPLEVHRQTYQTLQQLFIQPSPEPEQVLPLLDSLKDYILYPFAQYTWLSKKPNLTLQEIQALQKILPPFISVVNLKQRWLQQQKQMENWQTIAKEEQSLPKSVSVQCLVMQAEEIQQQAKKLLPSTVKQLNKLWLTGGSLPSSCDPLLDKWKQEGHLTANLIIQRGELAFRSNNQPLLRHLITEAKDPNTQQQLMQYLRLREKPSIILNKKDPLSVAKLIKNKAKGKMIITTIFPSFVYQLPAESLPKGFSFDTLNYWEKAFRLSNAEIKQWHTLLVRHFFDATNPKIEAWRDKQLANLKNDGLIERRIRIALRQKQKILPWLNRLSVEAQRKQEWQFWLGYAKQQIKRTTQARKIWENLMKERGFYPMLAAQMLKETYNPPILYFNPPENIFSPKVQETLALISELRTMKEEQYAVRAWYALLHGKSVDEKLAFAHYASEKKWFELQVDGTIQARAWGYLSLRLPMAYTDWFNMYLEGKDISHTFAMAIARQESGWRARIKSHANAYGLMQLLPSTAKQTAQRQNLPYDNTKQLLEPEQNIMLGVSLLQELYGKYGNNRILIAAAYNAGPNRVDSWLASAKGALSMAEFVATIPYLETRGYVENVLSYDYFYQLLQKRELMKFTIEEFSRKY